MCFKNLGKENCIYSYFEVREVLEEIPECDKDARIKAIDVLKKAKCIDFIVGIMFMKKNVQNENDGCNFRKSSLT